MSVQNSPLLTAPIPQMMRKIGTPVAVGATFNTLYNVVDTMYGGLISDQALAALSLSFPIFFFIIAAGFGFSQGNTALIGNSLGRGDLAQAQERTVQGIVFGFFSSTLLTIAVVATAPTMVGWMGATEEGYRNLALAYINPIFYGAIFFVTLQMMNAALNALGDTKPGRDVLIAGFFANLVLDPWFIFGGFGLPAMGITGIALATVTTQALGCVYLGYKLWQTELISPEIIAKHYKPKLAVFRRILEQGIPGALDMLSISIGFFILTIYVSQFGPNAVAALGAGSRLEQVAFLPVLGLNVAVISLVARNNGAQQYDRVQETYRRSLVYAFIILATTTLLISGFSRPLMRLFTSDPEIIQIGVEFTWIRNLGAIPSAIYFMSASSMRGIERPYLPLLFNVFRSVILPLVVLYVLITQMGFGLRTIWISTTLIFALSAIVGYAMARYYLPRPSAETAVTPPVQPHA